MFPVPRAPLPTLPSKAYLALGVEHLRLAFRPITWNSPRQAALESDRCILRETGFSVAVMKIEGIADVSCDLGGEVRRPRHEIRCQAGLRQQLEVRLKLKADSMGRAVVMIVMKNNPD